MGFGGCKISGHSGTSFKHRQPYGGIKHYLKATEYSDIEYSNNELEINSHTPVTKGKNPSKFREYILMGITILVSVFMVFYVFNYVDNNLRFHTEYNFLNQQYNKGVKGYEDNVHAAYDNLKRNKLDKAELYFTLALDFNQCSEEARTGITRVYQEKCVRENVCCREYEENFSYLVDNGFKIL